MPYTYADVETAIARADGQPLGLMKVGGINGSTAQDLGPSRTITTQGNSPYPDTLVACSSGDMADLGQLFGADW